MSNNNNKNNKVAETEVLPVAMVKCEVIGSRVRAGKQVIYRVGEEVELSKEDAERLEEMKVVKPVKAKK